MKKITEREGPGLTRRPKYSHLFSSLDIGDFTIPNRIVCPTHATGLGVERELRYLEERARGGVGFVGLQAHGGVRTYSVGHAPCRAVPAWDERPPSPVGPSGVAYYDEVAIPGLKMQAEAIHAAGARCFGQVHHTGAAPHTTHRISPAIAPSNVPDPYEALVPHALTEDEIYEVAGVFAHGIRRVSESGIDAAEIHAAHGYLINQFLSPYFNRRTDQWGGSVENRLRIVRLIIAEARKLVRPSFPIGIRVGVDGDGHRRGLTEAGLVEVCRGLANEVAYISVSGGNYVGFGDGLELAYVSPLNGEPGVNVATARAIREAVRQVPVLVTGRIADLSLAEGIVAEGSADMVGMVRALIADPEIPKKAAAGDEGAIRMCLGVKECHNVGQHRAPVTCAVNAAAGREREMEIVRAADTKSVAVIGAGPAGMEAARVAALRGHTVYLADARRQMGGTIRILARDNNRRNLLDHVVYYESQLSRLGVHLLLGSRVDAQEVIDFAPDCVVVATGGRPMVPEVSGIDSPHVTTAMDLLLGRAALAERVVVVGGLDRHAAACSIAEFVADGGHKVEVITEHADIAKDVDESTRLPILKRLVTKGVAISPFYKLCDAMGGGATIEHTLTGDRRRLDDATIVLACGLTPDDSLAKQIGDSVREVYLIGDALAPRRLMYATLEGARVGKKI